MKNNIIKIDLHQRFNFKCYPGIKCFNACCQDLQQILTPYDIIRLKHHFNIQSSLFLKKYTRSFIGPETGLPVIMLKTKSNLDLRCIFVSDDGCNVYSDRPASCRYYPLSRLVSRSRETGKKSVTFLLIKESHCLGHNENHQQSIKKWLNSQELSKDDTYNDRMLDLIASKNKAGIKTLSNKQKDIFFMCCYDIDSFKDHAVKHQLISKTMKMKGSIADDLEWLDFALTWVNDIFR
jgi:hypothetical protein